ATLENPSRRLLVPNKVVADDEHPVLFAELHVAVRGSKVISIRPRLYYRPLHDVLRRDGVELPLHQRGGYRVSFRKLGLIQSSANQELPLKDVFQAGCSVNFRGLSGNCFRQSAKQTS